MLKSKGLFGKKPVDIEVREATIAPPTDDQVLVKVQACGVCGTDVNFCRDWKGEAMPLGHEIAAQVIEVGANVSHVQVGDTVIVEDCSLCGICPACKAGHPELCRNLIDIEGQPGMAEYMVVHSRSLVPYEDLDPVTACLTEPLAVCITAVENAEIPLGSSVVVLGPGPLGLMSARLAQARGAGFVAVVGRAADNPCRAARVQAAQELGCDMVLEIGRQDVEAEIRRLFPNGVDRVIVSAPPKSIHDALGLVRFGGIITFFGLDFGGNSQIAVDVNDLVFQKITLRATFAEPAIHFPTSIRLLQSGLVDAGSLITHTFGFDQAADNIRSIIRGDKPIVKAVMCPFA